MTLSLTTLGRLRDGASLAYSLASSSHFRAYMAPPPALLQTGNVERNLAKIFREKIKVFGAPVQFTQVCRPLCDIMRLLSEGCRKRDTRLDVPS
jgi:hypothetical protein